MPKIFRNGSVILPGKGTDMADDFVIIVLDPY